jgi:hypothetical protein
VVSLGRKRAAASGKGALRRAYRASINELKAAGELASGGDMSDAAGRAARALRSYLAVGAGVSEVTVDQDAVSSLSNLGEDTRRGLSNLLSELDRTRFAPVGAGGQEIEDLIGKARSLIDRVHSGWNR